MWGWFAIQKFINMVYHSNSLKKTHMLCELINTNHLTKSIIYLWFLKTRNTRELPQSNKENLPEKKKKNPHSQHYTYNDERLNTVLLRLGFRREYLLSPLMLNIILEWVKTKKQKTYKLGREKGTLLHCWWECNLGQSLWEQYGGSLKKLKIELLFDPAIPLLGIYPEKTIIWKDTCTRNVHCSTVYNSQDVETV